MHLSVFSTGNFSLNWNMGSAQNDYSWKMHFLLIEMPIKSCPWLLSYNPLKKTRKTHYTLYSFKCGVIYAESKCYSNFPISLSGVVGADMGVYENWYGWPPLFFPSLSVIVFSASMWIVFLFWKIKQQS